MTTLTFHVARGAGARVGPRRRDRCHRAGSPRQRRAVAGAGARARRHHPDGRGCAPRPASSTGSDLERRSARARGCVAIGAASNALGTINDVAPRGRAGPCRGRAACSSTPSTTRRTRWWTSRRSAATCSRARPTSSTARTSACSTAATICSTRSTCPSCAGARTTAPERLETGTQNHEGIVGAAAAVDFLASLDRATGPTRRAALESVFAALHARGQALVTRLYERAAGDSWRDASTARRPISRGRRPWRSSSRTAHRTKSRASSSRAGCFCPTAISTRRRRRAPRSRRRRRRARGLRVLHNGRGSGAAGAGGERDCGVASDGRARMNFPPAGPELSGRAPDF